MTGVARREVDVMVVGAGPSGLSAATWLRRLGVERVEVIDREEQVGGIPRHSFHTGFGIRDLHRVLSGPAYARHHGELARRAGARLRTGVAATDWAGPLTLRTTSRDGIEEIAARAVVLATGARERPRTARLVAGARPAGVYTTGELQQSVYLYGQHIGERAVVVGAEHVSYSAVMTLHHAKVRVAAMVTDQPRHQSFAAFDAAARLRYRFPLIAGHQVAEILGNNRVSGVRLRGPDGGERTVHCDTIVFTGDWVPDHELSRLRGLQIDPGSASPSVDTALRTSATGVFAAGNLIHPVQTADIAALSGRAVAASVSRYLAGDAPDPGHIAVVAGAPLLWASPHRVDAAVPPPLRRFVLWSGAFVPRPVITISQDGRELWRRRLRRTLVPNQPYRLPADWLSSVHASAGPIRIDIAGSDLVANGGGDRE
ncbi:NAD(P)/FAD-dependent oxidoreductase [Phytohabitans kaempferiae]|uniref:NAD(P)/FAD-dependent oxidoreductase n=1 Tax=Phytohabitans kaempferiae TaxID=1620943 RepID=A0ABV6MAG2_9ACTN